jgi:hypothetical protein
MAGRISWRRASCKIAFRIMHQSGLNGELTLVSGHLLIICASSGTRPLDPTVGVNDEGVLS